MTPNKHWFSDFKPLNHEKVFMGNNQVCDIKGIGYVFIKVHDGVTRKLTEVRYVPDLRRNLISLGVLDSNGFFYKSENGILRRDGLFTLIGKIVCKSSALISQTVPEKTMLKIFYVVTKLILWIFVSIVFWKNSTKSVFQSAHTSPPLSLTMCTMICGDLKRFQPMVTVRHNSQQNGIAERMNHTIMDKIRCLMVSSGVPKPFWGEVVSTAIYLINSSPSTTINFKTPLELWSGEPPNLSNLRVFGCDSCSHQKEETIYMRQPPGFEVKSKEHVACLIEKSLY
ncbi:hypothetical protein M9H77_12685 [Catharanthus roseus]|uniref:Uncharacterized protein n=1 Tax=Catharanthus roseus TaxID=4058 RepID=A0ACC0BI46_CATRO|nr:hypothetical protein M9H77_12685 [Catharanthus roseus]